MKPTIPRRLLIVLWTLVLALIGAGCWWRAELPERVASHFSATGAADGWMPREQLLLVIAGIAVLIAALFSVLAGFAARCPDAWINLPNKSHWLSAEQRSSTMRRLIAMSLGMGIATVLLLLVVLRTIVVANRAAEPRASSATWVLLAAYGVSMACIAGAGLMPFFRRPSRDALKDGAPQPHAADGP